MKAYIEETGLKSVFDLDKVNEIYSNKDTLIGEMSCWLFLFKFIYR